MSLADYAYNRRQPQKIHQLQSVFLCEIMQLCCIPLRDLRYLRENIHIRVLNLSAQRNPMCLPQISQIIADKPQNNTNYKLSFSAK